MAESPTHNSLGGTVHGGAVQAGRVDQVNMILNIGSWEAVVRWFASEEVNIPEEHSHEKMVAIDEMIEESNVDEPIDSDALIAWVGTTILPLIGRISGVTATWCERWWEHAEAVFRFEVVRRAWEGAVVSSDPQAMSDWALHVLDPHINVLTSPNGPFSQCAQGSKHHSQSHNLSHELPNYSSLSTDP